MKHHILVIDDDINIRNSMRSFLQDEGFQVRTFASGDEAIALIRQSIVSFTLAMVDFHLLGECGTEVIRQIMAINPKFKIIGFSGDRADHVSLESYQSGAINFIEKGSSQMILLAMIHRLCKEYELENKTAQMASTSENQAIIEQVGMIGRSQVLADVARVILKAAGTNSNILIRGEPGTGKELIAKGIHSRSKRASHNFIAINSGAISESLSESELFGHEKGAFTGANQRKVGKFQAADKGTIFFDEIGEMNYEMQKVLLRALQERKITPVGANLEIPVDVRIIAATNAPLEEMNAGKSFRQDLFDRLNVIQIFAPPLRDRVEDIPLLIAHFLRKLNASTGSEKEILAVVVDKIQESPPSGNVRGLQNLVERLHALSEGHKIDLPVLAQSMSHDSGFQHRPQQTTLLRKNIEQIRLESLEQEKKSIEYALEVKDTLTAAADFLDVTREYLRSRIRSLKIETSKEHTSGHRLKMEIL